MVLPSEKGTQTKSRILKVRESRHEDSIPALVVKGAVADEMVSRLERRMIAWTRGRVRNVLAPCGNTDRGGKPNTCMRTPATLVTRKSDLGSLRRWTRHTFCWMR